MTRTWMASISFLAAVTAAAAQDWPQWRGPDRDGAATSFEAPASWPQTLTEQWRIDVGLGYASPLLVDGTLYLFTRQGDDEVLTALDAESGKTRWRTAYSAAFEMVRATAKHGPGPKSTPTFANGRLFTLGMRGDTRAFDAATGKELWHHPAPPVQPLYHTAMSPIVDGDLVIVHIGGHDDGALAAFDVSTGQIRWSWDGDGPAYGSPMVFDLAGARQVVTFTQKHLVGVSAASGELLWSRPFTTPHDTTSLTPILYKDTVIQTGRDNGITAFRVMRQGDGWSTEDVWHTDEVSLYMTNAVVLDGMLFGLSHLNSGQYFALDLDDGKVLWTGDPRQAENAGIVRAGDTIFSLEDDAELLIFRGTPSGFAEQTRYEVAPSATWTQPTISGKRVYVKDVSTLTLFTLE